MMKSKFVWIVLFYPKKTKTQLQTMDTAHANVTAVTNNQQKL